MKKDSFKVEIWIGEEDQHTIEIYTDIEISEMPVHQEDFTGTREDAVQRSKDLVREWNAAGLEIHHPDGQDTVVVM
jgi:hypothetical protein